VWTSNGRLYHSLMVLGKKEAAWKLDLNGGIL